MRGLQMSWMKVVLAAFTVMGMLRAELPQQAQAKPKPVQVEQKSKVKKGSTKGTGKNPDPISGIVFNPGDGDPIPCGAYISTPGGPITVTTGQVVAFEGFSDNGNSFRWTFGDTTSAMGDTVTHAFATAGTFSVILRVTDTGYVFSPSSTSVDITVVAAQPSVAVSPGTAAVGPGGTQAFTAAVTGLANTAVTWSLPGGSSSGSITSAGVYTAPAALGTYTVKATSQANTSVFGTATITVANPSVTVNPSTVNLKVGTTQAFTATVTNLSNTAVTWSLPGGSSTGTITTAGLYTAPATSGTYTVQAKASNGVTTGLATVIVDKAPVYSTTLTAQSLVQGKPYSLTLPVATDGDGDALTYSVTGLPAGLQYLDGPPRITGTPAAAGSFTVVETVTDGKIPTSQSATFTVAANAVPVFSSTAPTQNLVMGKPYTFTFPAATDANGDVITYTVTGLPQGLSNTSAANVVPVIKGTPLTTTPLVGVIASVIYTATDSKGAPVSQTITFRVAPDSIPVFPGGPIPTLNVAVGQSFIAQLPSGTDGDLEPLTYSFSNWSNYATQLSGLSWNSTTLVLAGSIPTAGTYALTYQAMDPKGAIATLTFTIVVTATNPVSFGAATFPTPIPALTAGVAMTPLILPAATDSGGQTPSYDLLGLPAGLSFNASTRTVSGTPAVAGSYALSERATVPRGYQAVLPGTWTVAAAAKNPPVFQSTIPVSYSLKAGVAMPDLVWPAATDPNGYTVLIYTLSGGMPPLPPGLVWDSATRKITGTPTSGGTWTVTYTVTDTFSQSASQTTTFVVEQALPVISSFVATQNSISPGGSTTLTWSVGGATTVTLSPNPGNAPINATGGSLPVTPAASTAYLLTATNAAGSTTNVLVVNVAGTTPTGLGSTASGLPIANLSSFTKAQFEEMLAYEWTDGGTLNRSYTGLITAVDVKRQLLSGLAGLTTAAPQDQAIRSHYDYGYDRLGQLLQANGAFYNDLTTTVAAWTDQTSYSYDAHGNRTRHTPRGVTDWAYAYDKTLSGAGVDTNRLTGVTTNAGATKVMDFHYTPDGAVDKITRTVNGTAYAQNLTYNDPRFMRLPTLMDRAFPDGRTVATDLRYDMSGTRIYKRDLVKQGTGVISDRETYYLANGTEVLMEVEKRGSSTNAAAPERYTAYVFGSGSRLARMSWDLDGRAARAAGTDVTVTNPDFSSGITGWTGVGTTPGATADADPLLKVPATPTGVYAQQALGSFNVGETVEVTLSTKVDSGVSAGIQLVPASGTPATSTAVTSGSLTPLKVILTVPATGIVNVRLTAAGTTNLNAYFDKVAVRRVPPVTTKTGEPNLWPDPGFENVRTYGAEQANDVAIVGGVSLAMDGSNREGLHVLSVPTGATYQRTVRGLTPSGSYQSSIWKKPEGGSWQRVTALKTADASGVLTLDALTGPAIYDQAELVSSAVPLPESWIPENRLGRVDWFITDHLGSTKLLVDQNGQSKFSGDDDPFGLNLRSFGDKDSHRYTGQILDDEEGLYYYGARYYLPEIGRFLSGDPIAEFNSWYAYVHNSPTGHVDPDGQSEAPFRKSVNGWNYYKTDGGFYGIGPNGQVRFVKTIPNKYAEVAKQNNDASSWMEPAAKMGVMSFGVYTGIGSALEYFGMAGAAGTAGGEAAAPLAKLLRDRYTPPQETQIVEPTTTRRAPAGRLGNQTTRDQVREIADKYEAEGWEIIGGGGRRKEEYIPGPGGARKGSSYPDITMKKDGKILRINTIDTRSDGITPTTREADNAARIRMQKPDDTLLLIPKPVGD